MVSLEKAQFNLCIHREESKYWEQQIKQLQKKLSESSSPWVPKQGTTAYYINTYNEIGTFVVEKKKSTTYSKSAKTTAAKIASGNYYKTKREAERARDRMLFREKTIKAAKKAWSEHEKPLDYSNTRQSKWTIYYDSHNKDFYSKITNNRS